MFTSKVCQRLCNLHEISIEKPVGPEVTWNERPNMSVNQITAQIQQWDKSIHWRRSLKGASAALSCIWGQLRAFSYMFLEVFFFSGPGFLKLVSPKAVAKEWKAVPGSKDIIVWNLKVYCSLLLRSLLRSLISCFHNCMFCTFEPLQRFSQLVLYVLCLFSWHILVQLLVCDATINMFSILMSYS